MTSIAGGWGSRVSSSPSCREAVIVALGENRNLMARFARACSEGLHALRELGVPVRRELQERRHRYETHAEQLEETLAALYDVAAVLLPASPGASLARLRSRVQERDGNPRDAVEGIEELVASDDVALEKLLLAVREGSDEYVMVVARFVYGELYRRGQRWEPDNFSQHVRAVMAFLCPPAWDEAWAASERHRALKYICARAADSELPYLPSEYAEVYAAEDARDTERYRAAVRALVVSARRMLWSEGRLLQDHEADPPPAAPFEPERDAASGSSSVGQRYT